ncbi:MAG: hypothetical protein ABSF70_14330 [Terracidiphilus sp.]|jgi:hypothetical protein
MYSQRARACIAQTVSIYMRPLAATFRASASSSMLAEDYLPQAHNQNMNNNQSRVPFLFPDPCSLFPVP